MSRINLIHGNDIYLILNLNYRYLNFNSNIWAHNMTKPTKGHVRPAKTQFSLRSWSESLLCAWWVAKEFTLLQDDKEDSDQTGRMPRLIWDFAERTSFCWFCHASIHMFLGQIEISIWNTDIFILDKLTKNYIPGKISNATVFSFWYFSSDISY